MAFEDTVTLRHTRTKFHSVLVGLFMGHGNMKVSRVILSVCLLLQAVQTAWGKGHDTGTLNDITFECSKGFSFYDGNCYKAIDVPVTMADAYGICLGQGSLPYYPRDEIEYHEYVAKLLPKRIWFGLLKDDDMKWKIIDNEVPLEMIPRWGDGQPNLMGGNATAVDPENEVMIYDANEMLPFVCKYQACLEDYMPCDLKCIPSQQVCNRLPECSDERDENNCPDQGTWYLRLSETTGNIQTQPMSDFEKQTWILEAPVGRRVRLYIPQMNLEENVVFLEVWSGSYLFQYSEMLGRFTGSVSSKYLYSTNSFLSVRFYAASDLSRTVGTYTFGWVTNIPSIPLGTEEEVAINNWKSIDMPFTNEEYTPKDLKLSWRISANEGNVITYYVQVRPKPGFTVDEVKYELKVHGMEDFLMDRHYYTSSSNEVQLMSNYVPVNGHVTLRYKLGCGMAIAETYGVIVSPHPIPNDLMCSWTLDAGEKASRGMTLKFLTLSLAQDSRTNPTVPSEDKFMIYADKSDEAVTTVKQYNDDVNNNIHAPNGHFKVEFISDSAFMSKGFTIAFGTDCKDLDISKETIKSTDNTFYKENVVLSCPAGYDFHMEKYHNDDSVTLHCDSTYFADPEGPGMWTIDGKNPGGIPECQEIYCGPPDKIQNGGVKSVTGVTYNKVATYFCNGGFDMKPTEKSVNATCGEDGKWRDVPSCTSSQCAALSTNILQNGKFEIIRGNDFTNNNADYDTVVEFSCNTGYELLGPKLSHCDSQGWTHENNLPSCQRISCPVPPIANSNVPLAGPTQPTLFEGTYSVTCNKGYKFTSGETGSVSLKCQADRTFDKTLVCEDIDECEDGSNLCNSDSTTCVNNIGGYTCQCKTGYKESTDFVCTDIKECEINKGGCSDTCVEKGGSYECQCPNGKLLYESNGFQGFNLPPGETGRRFGDLYYIDHTCVAKQCPALEAVANGQYLSRRLDNYHFEDTITLQCNDGYKVTGLTTTSAVSTCTADGTWNEVYTCEARKCTLPTVPANGKYDKTEVNFGERLKLTCQLTDNDADKRELNAVCVYKDENTGLGFVGDDITQCPQIDCGSPVMPIGGKFFNNIPPPTTTFLSTTSKFTFDCEDGYDVIGSSGDEDGDTVVKCKANSRWNFGTLACAGKMCSDPGVLGGAVRVYDGFDIGSELYYTCVRDGFTVPDIKYKCQFINGNAVWSNNLENNLPECTDSAAPTFSGSCGDVKNVDAVDSVSFNRVTASDNFRLASMTMSDNIQPGDRIITDTSVQYTAVDFEGNSETCSITFNIIDRSEKPLLNCPNSKTYLVDSRDSQEYNYETDVQVTNGNIISVDPPQIISSVDKIGSMEIITITATNEFNTESSCTYMIHFVAGACFEEELFTDSNANRVCDTDGDDLVCTSTCKSGYKFSDKTEEKTFRCTGSGSWNYVTSDIEPHDRFCLREANPKYEVALTIQHRFGFLTLGCLEEFTSAVTGTVNNFESRIRTLCNQLWDISDVNADTISNNNFVYETTMKLTLLSPVSVTNAEECIQKLVDDANKISLFAMNNNLLTCDGEVRSLTVETVSAGQGTKNCDTGFYLDENICLQYGPGQYFDVQTNTVKTCPDGQYQDGLAQTSCRECPAGQYPNGDKTGCQLTCPAGFTSQSGFYPCTPCQQNSFWIAKDECSPCPTDYSTVGLKGAVDENKCYAPCPKGTYSRSGYDVNGCTSCPLNFYQDETGQVTCKECSTNSVTTTTGSIHTDNCTTIQDECNRAYCNNNGECSFKRHRRFCTCDANTGYYGERCQNMYHICDGNPCTNGGVCNRGATYRDYTCSCRTDLDTCEMKESTDNKIGSQQASALYRTSSGNLEQCKAACNNDDQCKEASFTGGFVCLLFNDNLQPADLIDQDLDSDVHLKKECNTAFGGKRCEQDTKIDCVNNDCNKNSQCKEDINSFECICPANGGFSGPKCNNPNTPCSPNPCENGGTCTPFGTVRYECTCLDGYTGINCEENINECTNNPDACAYDGVCKDQVNGYTCECKSSFGGTNCENTPDFCLTNDCKGENVCYNSLDRMEGVCTCDTTLFETRYRCEMPVTENRDYAEGEIVSSKNVNDIEQCKTACQDNRECSYAIYNTAQNPNCKLYDNLFKGKPTDDSSFEIRKNCGVKPDVGYACDQVKLPCDDVDCNDGTCQNINSNLDSICVCNPGYTGSLCQHSIDDCVNNACENDAECVDGDQTYTCSCKPGFEGNRCQNNINDCPGTCNTENGRCEDRINGFECICNPGFVGENCEIDFNECSSNPCKHGGECKQDVNNFECECKDGYTGEMCENMKDNCAGVLTCLNDGECISLQETSFCRCEGGATGDRCEDATLLCDTLSNTDVCINSGTCVNSQGTASCKCPIVYDKERCYMEEGLEGTGGGQVENPKISTKVVNSVSECKELCLNNELCTAVSYSESGALKFCQFYTVSEEKIQNVVGSTHFIRNCPEDYKGVSCEIVKDWCTLNPCKNDGLCIPLEAGYECKCMPGYSGATCEIVADPCTNTPCLGRADCSSTSVSSYDCLCTEGRTWTGSSCKNSRTDYTMVVNAADGRKAPASLQTLFHLKTKELSVLMWVRVHFVNAEVALGTVFALLGTKENKLPEDLMFDFSLTVSRYGIYVRYGAEEALGISFLSENNFGEILLNGEWHHLGISLTSDGMLSASVDSLHVEEPVDTGRKLDLDLNAQIHLGYGHIAEYRNVEVYSKSFESSVFSMISTGGDRPDIPPVQSFQNYNLHPSTTMNEKDLSSNVAKNPNLDVPDLECDDVEDVYYATSERLVSRSTISDLADTIESVKQKSESTLQYMDTIEPTTTWGVYPLIIIGMDKVTKNYGQCIAKLVNRYNAACPVVNELFSDTVSYKQCSEAGGYCDITCTEETKVLAAPVPYYIPCGTLGVYDYRMPFAETYYPECVDTSSVGYKLDASMVFKLQTECSKTQENILGIIDDRVKDSFKDEVNQTWPAICDDDDCSNLKDIKYDCDTIDIYGVAVTFSLVLKSMTLQASGGGSVDIENALKIIIRNEELIDLKTVSGAVLKGDTVVIRQELECPEGHRLHMTEDSPVCVPCSKGYYLMNEECMPCDYGHYQNMEAQTKCEPCPDGKVTYRKGVKDVNECKVKCLAGQYYDKDEDKCMACKRHFYQHEEGRNYCIPCDNEYKTVEEGSDSENDCKVDCPAGEARSKEDGKCELCLRGYWRSLTYDDCQKCPESKTTFLNEHARDESDCKMDICELGSYFDRDDSMECKKCPVGYYQDKELELSCSECPGNLTTSEEGSDNKDKCQFYCPAGYEIQNDNQCKPCERGTYKDNDGLSKFLPCQQCPQDTTDTTGATAVSLCNIPKCTAGQYIEDGTCKDCERDSYSDVELPTSSTKCLQCPTLYGTEQTGSTSEKCTRYCPPGSFLNGDDCERCPRGYYKDNSGNTRFDSCVKCPDRNGKETMTDNIGSDNIDDCSVYKCEAGYVSTDFGCEPCDLNTYQPDQYPLSTDTCKPCPLKAGKITNTKTTGTATLDECLPICDAGRFLSESVCVSCARGTYKENIGDARFGECTTCPEDKTTETTGAVSQSLCTLPKCAAGQYLKDNICTDCDIDSYSEVETPNSQVQCIPCGTRNGIVYGTEQSGTSLSSLCKATCPGGKEYNEVTKQCEDCPIERYKGDDDRFGSCKLCEDERPGYVAANVGSKSADQCTIRNCPAGSKIEGTECTLCPVKTYQDKPRQTECEQCGINLSTDGEGKTSPDDCQTKCGPGLEGIDSCKKCEPGKFKPEEGYDVCQDCELDRTSNEERTKCDIYYCSIGKEYNNVDGVESCTECQEGFFKNVEGNDVKCQQCPAGFTTDGTGKGSCDLLYCVPGRYKEGSECVECKVGTYKVASGNDQCTPCPDGTTTDTVTGATAATQCDTVVCDKGKYRKPGQKQGCFACEVGTYQPESGSTSCINCPAGEITLENGQFTADACVPECKAGEQYNPENEECFLCPTGSYKESVGNIDQCKPCPTDKTTAGPGAKLASDCSQNKCPPGKYFVVVNDVIDCRECQIGRYSDQEMVDTCTVCPDDKTTQAVGTKTADMCIPDCDSGEGYKTNLAVCITCPKGQYNKKDGLNPNTCKLCPAGTTNYQSGSTACAFTIPPIQDNRIKLIFIAKVDVAINECTDTDSILGITKQIEQTARKVFQERTDNRYNGELRFCHGDSCDNLAASVNPTCEEISQRKRAITHRLLVQFIFNDISEFITDTLDNNANIEAVEVISQILRLYAAELSDLEKEILFVGYQDVTTEDICEVGESRVDSACVPCAAGTYGSSSGVCKECPQNTYQDMTGEKQCKSCPDKSYTEQPGSTSKSQCIAICQAGFEFKSETKTCSECEIGYYKREEGNEAACSKCSSDKTTKTTGSTSQDDCTETLCQAGEFYTVDILNVKRCSPCPVGQYNPSVNSAMCQKCASTKTTLDTGKKSEDDCIEKCQPGYGYQIIDGNCAICPDGQYNDAGDVNPNFCKYCPDGQTTDKAGQTQCTPTPIPPVINVVIIRVPLVFFIVVNDCDDTSALNKFLSSASLSVGNTFKKARTKKYKNNRSFCNNEDCDNFSLKFKDNNPRQACSLRTVGRRKRQTETTHAINLVAEFKNVSDRTVDSDTGASLPTKDVINEIIENNKDSLSPDSDSVFSSAGEATESVICGPGQNSVNNQCVDCGTGRYSENGETCVMCPTDTYQDTAGQSSCKSCPARTYNDETGATDVIACKSYCVSNPNYCNNRGICSDTGRRSASCSCYENYEGSTCASKKEPTSDLPAILGGAIGGGGALLIIILIIVGVFMKCSRDSVSRGKKHKHFHDPEYVQNGAYEGTYDNYGYHGSQVRPVAPYPSIGYPALGYKPDQSFEEETYGGAYKYRPSVNGDDFVPREDSRFVWTA